MEEITFEEITFEEIVEKKPFQVWSISEEKPIKINWYSDTYYNYNDRTLYSIIEELFKILLDDGFCFTEERSGLYKCVK